MGAGFPACWLYRGDYYQHFGRGPITTVRFYARYVKPLTPSAGAYSGATGTRLQTARHSHSATSEITSPNNSSAAAHTSAETKLATWKRQYGISKMPAASGTEARNGPKNRPMKMLGTPQFFTKASPRGSRSG